MMHAMKAALIVIIGLYEWIVVFQLNCYRYRNADFI